MDFKKAIELSKEIKLNEMSYAPYLPLSDNSHDAYLIQTIFMLHIDEINAKKILDLFSAFISSNPDFKYNYFYFSDSTEDFLKQIKQFKDIHFITWKSINDVLKNYIEYKRNISLNLKGIIEYSYDEDNLLKCRLNRLNNIRYDIIGEEKFLIELKYTEPSINNSYIFEYNNLEKDLTYKINEFIESIKSISQNEK